MDQLVTETANPTAVNNQDLSIFNLDGKVYTFVSVLGLFNRGKTFLINKLAGRKLDSSRRISTKGISLLLPSKEASLSDRQVVYIDTAGTSSPLENFSEDIAPMMSKKALELFLNDATFRLSDVLICVIGEVYNSQFFLSLYTLKIPLFFYLIVEFSLYSLFF